MFSVISNDELEEKTEHPMGVENPQSGKYFINALDQLLASINCDDLKMSDYTS